MTRRPDRGSASIWVVSCCALLMVVAGAATLRGLAVLARHRAESSADLAALAAAGRIGIGPDECSAAARVAGRNGARLRACTVKLAGDGRSGVVVVRVALPARLPLVGANEVIASARAAREPSAQARKLTFVHCSTSGHPMYCTADVLTRYRVLP